MRNRAFAAMTLAVLALASVAVPSTLAKSAQKVAICHYDAVTATYGLISVKATAVGAHMAHGDGAPGDGQFDSACRIIDVPVIFVRVWSNADGVPGFQAGGSDVLIAELVDGQPGGPGVPDAGPGDILHTYQYPSDFGTSSFGTFGVTTHIVASLGGGSGTSFTDPSGNVFEIWSSPDFEGYGERTPGAVEGSTTDVTLLVDHLAAGADDMIRVGTASPSSPQSSLNLKQSSPGDDGFVDVEFVFGS